jgi:hypothetical protein
MHGERPTPLDLLLTYGVAVVFATLALAFGLSRVSGLPAWKAVLLWIIAADMAGGVVSTFTEATQAYYARRPLLRWLFLSLHVAHPAVLYLLFGGRPAYWGFLFLYAMAAASVVNGMRSRTRQEIVAVALYAVGVGLLLPVFLMLPYLAWFGPLFLLKLIVGFAVRRG